MFAKFDNKIYWVRSTYALTQPSSTSKKRKRSSECIFILHDCDSEEIAVREEDCVKISTSFSYSFKEELIEFLERKLVNRYSEHYSKRLYLKCSYKTNPNKEYYIKSISL